MCEKIRGKRVLKVSGLFDLVGTKEKLLGNCLIFSSFSFYSIFFWMGETPPKNWKLIIYLWQFIIIIYGLESFDKYTRGINCFNFFFGIKMYGYLNCHKYSKLKIRSVNVLPNP